MFAKCGHKALSPIIFASAVHIAVLMKMLDGASHIINFAHQVVMPGTDEELGAALELLLGLAGVRQNQSLYASALLV